MLNEARKLALACTIIAATQVAAANWESIHQTPSNHRHVAANATVLTVSGGPFLQSADTALSNGVGVIIVGDTVYTVGRTTSPDTVFLVARDKNTGAPVPGFVETPLSNVGFDFSLTTPSFADGGLFFASGNTVYRLNATTGSVVWETDLDATNSDPSASALYDVTNASPIFGDGKVYIQTYAGFGPYDAAQLVAVDAVTGDTEWFVVTGGVGSSGPAYFQGTTTNLVIAPTGNSSQQGGLSAYNSSNGAVVWSVPNTLSNMIWTEPVVANGEVFAVTYNFGGTNGQLLRVNAEDGTVLGTYPTITSDCPPIIVGDRVYLFGGTFFSPVLNVYNRLTGAEEGTLATPGNPFRQYPVALNDKIYLATGGLHVIDATSLTIDNSYTTGSLNGPVTVDPSTGFIYTNRSGSLFGFNGSSNVSDWFMIGGDF